MNLALLEFAFNSPLPPPPPPSGPADVVLPFSRRETTAVSVFPCIFAAKFSQTLTSTASIIGALQVQYAQLNSVYAILIHQDTANNAAVLHTAIATSLAIVTRLNTTVQLITSTLQNAVALANVQSSVKNALGWITLVEAQIG